MVDIYKFGCDTKITDNCFTDSCTKTISIHFSMGFSNPSMPKDALQKGRTLRFNNTKNRKNPTLIMEALLGEKKQLRSGLYLGSLCDLLLRHFPGMDTVIT